MLRSEASRLYSKAVRREYLRLNKAYEEEFMRQFSPRPGEEQVTETYSDLQGPLTKEEYELGGRRIAALVALCEEVLDDPDQYMNRGEYRARLARLKGEG